MPSGSFSKRARNTDSVVNRKNCGGNKKAGLAPRATGPTQFRNVAFNTHPAVNFKVSKGNLPCPTNYSNNPGGQCAGGVGALASTRNRGCTYSHSNVRSGGNSSGFSCPPASLDAYVGEWRVAEITETGTETETTTFTMVTITEADRLPIEQLFNITIVGNKIVQDRAGTSFFKLSGVSGEKCDKIYILGEEEYFPANPVEFSLTNNDGRTITFTKL